MSYWSDGRNARALSRRRFVKGAGAGSMGLAALALAGCGDDDDTPASTSSAGTTGPSTAATAGASAQASTSAQASAAATPRRGGVFNYAHGGEPPSLDIHRVATTSLIGEGAGQIYSTLLKPQSTGHKGALIPVGDLAASWEQPDPTTYVFKLRPNVKFHNVAPVNGRVAVAEDIVFSFKRQISEKANAAFLAGMKDITAVDPGTLRITVESPNVDFLVNLTSPFSKIVPKESIGASGNLETGPLIGTGPWIFKEWKKGFGSGQFMTKNPDYFIPGLPYADELNPYYLVDPAAIEAQFISGKLNYVSTSQLPLSKIKAFDKAKFSTYKGTPSPNLWVLFNHDTPQFADPRIRQALSMAIDRELILANVYENEGIRDGMSMVLPGPDWRLPQEELAKLLPYDPKGAKTLFDQAGGVPKQPLLVHNLQISQNGGPIVQSNWKQIGFETEIRIIEPAEYNSAVVNPAVSKFTVGVFPIAHGPTLTSDLESYFVPGGSRNGQRVNDPELTKLIQAQKAEFDEKKRRDLVNQIQRLVISKHLLLSMGALGGTFAFPKSVHNIEVPAATGAYHWRAEVWFDA